MERNSDDGWNRPNRYLVEDEIERAIHPAASPFSGRFLVNALVYKSSSRHLRLRASRLRSFENCLVIVASYVRDARPVWHFRHRRPKHYADNWSVTADYQTSARV